MMQLAREPSVYLERGRALKPGLRLVQMPWTTRRQKSLLTRSLHLKLVCCALGRTDCLAEASKGSIADNLSQYHLRQRMGHRVNESAAGY